MGKDNEMRDKVVDAFEESTGQAPNDYEMGTINALVRDYESNEEQSKR